MLIRGLSLLKKFQKTCEKLECNVLEKSEVITYDEYIGTGYGEPTEGMIEATKLLAKKEAILLDPVYSGKAFAGLIGMIRKKQLSWSLWRLVIALNIIKFYILEIMYFWFVFITYVLAFFLIFGLLLQSYLKLKKLK